jgi:hypothetical protein
MESIDTVLKRRISRMNLHMNTTYEKITNTKNLETAILVGRFIRSYSMGSGDGTTAHWEFVLNGQIITVNDQMWGSVSGEGLVGFREVEEVEAVEVGEQEEEVDEVRQVE